MNPTETVSIEVPEKHASLFNTKIGFCHPSKGISVIIPIRGTERNENLILSIKFLLTQNMKPIEIIVIEEDVKPVVDLQVYKGHPQVTHLFLDSQPGVSFNKARAMNCGVAYARHEAIVMNDVDMALEKTMLWHIYHKLQQFDTCFSIKQIYFLTEMPHTTPYKHNGQTWLDRAKFFCHGGTVAFNKTAYIAMGGMNEAFVGYGSEDTEFWRRAKAVTKCSDERFATVLHMPHPIHEKPNEIARNKNLLDRLQKMDQNVVAGSLRDQFYLNWGKTLDPKYLPPKQ